MLIRWDANTVCNELVSTSSQRLLPSKWNPKQTHTEVSWQFDFSREYIIQIILTFISSYHIISNSNLCEVTQFLVKHYNSYKQYYILYIFLNTSLESI